MKVMEEVHADDLKDEEQLTTKFMRDWRVKDLRILFLGERNDTYSPATSTHILNLLPMLYLQRIVENAFL